MPTMHRLALVALLLLPSVAFATTTRFFRHTTAKDFEEGEATGTLILSAGDVVPGFKTARVPIDAAFAWCAALSRDGRVAYFGTGDDGRVYAVSTNRNDKAQQLAKLDTPWVTALAVRPDGSLVAGSTPGGAVFILDPQTGANAPFAKLPAEHVWALLVDPKTAVTYVATGTPGKVFAIDKSGGQRLVWDSGDKHVTALAFGLDGSLLAGTAEEAILYRVSPDGRALALHDFEADEIRAIVRAGNATYLAVNDFDRPSDATAVAVVPTPGKGTRINLGPAPASGTVARSETIKARAAVYRLEDDGRIEQVFALADGYFTSMLVDPAGDVFAASGNQGKVYRISPDRTAALAVDLPERQALALVRTADGFLVGSGDVGALFRVRPAVGVGADATYLSRVLDADGPAAWGSLRWSGSADLVFETRSGNTAKPDRSWTDWKKPSATRHLGDEGQGKVQSPGARYLQYRVVLPAGKSVLREVTASCLPQNQRARITDIYLDPGTTPTTPTPRSHSPLLKLRWKVENPDNDELVYRLSFRIDGETVWRPLGGPDPLTKAEYDWNTESVPDGRYVIRVWASDEKVTPSDRALDSTFESPPFLVDNARPEVLDLTARPSIVTGRAHDAGSVITQIEFSVDGDDWRPVSPDDRILDESDEPFSLKLPHLPAGPHIVTVRAWDSADNVGSARLQVQAK
jgi:sugar lactone lactonase YvrE